MDEQRRGSANGGESETFNKVHHDLDVAAERRKPIVTEHKYKVNVAEPGVETLPLADHDGAGRKTEKNEGYSARKSEKTTVTKTSTSATAAAEKKPKATGESQKGQFIAKPDVYGREREDDDDDDESGGGNFPWVPVLAGAAAIAGAIAGAIFYRKRNPDVDAKVRRSVEDADHRVKGALGSGERKVKDIIGSGQQKFNSLLHRGGDHHDTSDDEGHGGSHGRGHHLFGGGSGDYQVKSGDNLTKIAKKSGKKSWHEIAEKNPSLRNPDLIYPGDRLNL